MPATTPSPKDFNDFAQGLVGRFAERAAGLDSESARLVDTRPSDHVLTGFLTPARVAKGQDEGTPEDEQLAVDLPLDSAYEQTNLGTHWLVPRAALERGSLLKCQLRLCVYVRRLPTRSEQQRALGLSRASGYTRQSGRRPGACPSSRGDTNLEPGRARRDQCSADRSRRSSGATAHPGVPIC